MNGAKLLAAGTVCLVLAACTNTPPLPDSIAAYTAEQSAAARQAQQAGQLARALNLWRSLLPLDNTNPETLAAIATLEQDIAQRSQRALTNGRAAYARGDRRRGDSWMLKVLALQPGQQQALALLRESSSRRAQQQQAAKSREQYDNTVASQEQEPESTDSPIQRLFEAADYRGVVAAGDALDLSTDDEAARLLRLSHIALADEAGQKDQYDRELDHLQAAMTSQLVVDDPLVDRSATLRIELSNDWYRKGSGLIQTDLPNAIAALEKSVDYNPQNKPARLKLKQARTLQRNLEKIKKN